MPGFLPTPGSTATWSEHLVVPLLMKTVSISFNPEVPIT
jgi:hypothetical protein